MNTLQHPCSEKLRNQNNPEILDQQVKKWAVAEELNLSYHNTESLLASMHMFLKTQYALIYSYETLNPETQLER